MVGESSQAKAATRRLRLGMVGGGQGAFIGAVHRLAARMDDRYELVAGAFSSTPEKSKASGAELRLAEGRCYGSYAEMAQREARLKDGIDVVSIVTPNHLHVPAALEFVRRGIHVICDKPLTVGMKDAKRLADALEKQPDVIFVLTHNYTGYPMIRQARQMVADGLLGQLRIVQVEYAQDWLTNKLEDTGQKQAVWRNDPKQSGPVGAVGDIGTHAMNLASFVSRLAIKELSADLTSFVEGRPLDDNAHIMLRYEGGAKGMLWASQVAPGNENCLRLRVFGDKGGLDWSQESPNYLRFSPYGEQSRLITRGGSGSGPDAARVTRVPAGHPEGYLEGFANIYTDAAELILAKAEGREPNPDAALVPGIQQGLEGVKFCEAVVESSKKNGGWIRAAT